MWDRMLRGELYVFDSPDIQAAHARAQALLERYNVTRHVDRDERERLLRELLEAVGEGVVVQPPLRCDYGANITVGAQTFINYDCVMLDGAPIAIGSHCQIAP